MCIDTLGIIPTAVKRNFAVLSDISKLMSIPKDKLFSGDYEGMADIIKNLRVSYPDLTFEQISVLFKNREDIV